LADAYDQAKIYSDSLRIARQEAAIQSGALGFETLSSRLFNANLTAEGRKVMEAGLRAYPEDANLLDFAASHEDDADNVAAAVALYKRELELDGTVTYARRAMAGLYKSEGDLAHARQTWIECRADQPQDASVA